MKKHEKLVLQSYLNDEEAVIGLLKDSYNDALSSIQKEAEKLQKEIETLDVQYGILEQYLSDEEKEKLLSMKRSKVYQKQYQDALKEQVSTILDTMHQEEFKTVSDYIEKCYEEGFLGAMYSLNQQGIPMCFPIDQAAVVRAVQLDSKISQGLYKKLGEDVNALKKTIASEVSRGISTGSSYSQIAQQIKARMTGVYDKKSGGALYRAETIARTEGHRVQVQSAMDACEKAKDMGADVVKQWDATMDKRTRKSHQMCDGEIRELDEPFSNGLMHPSDPDGGASEVINCRCALLQRARWALDEDELEELKKRAEYFGIDKTKNFEDFKAKYIDAVQPPEPAVKPKKEYLTEKKLKHNIDDADAELKDLKKQMEDITDVTFDDFEGMGGVAEAYSDLEDLFDGDDLKEELLKKEKALKIEKKIQDLQNQKADWQEKLDKKLVAKETKKLKKEQILLQDELDNFETHTYSNIWKDDVTEKDWIDKKDSIEKKKQYFKSKWLSTSDPDEEAKWQALIDLCDEFDQKGSEYYNIQQKLNKKAAELKKLQKSGKLKQNDLDAFTQDRKDAAMWAKTTKDADERLRDKCGEVWKNASKNQRYAIYDYTSGSGKFNRPLAGFEKPYSEWGSGWEPKWNKGVGNVWIDFEGAGDEIRGMTELISQSSYDFDMWLQRGCGGNAMESFLGLSPNTFTQMSHSELQQFVGQSNRMYSFTSTGVAKGKGFSGDCILNIYAPSGTQMMYAEPFSAFGNGSGLNWDGITAQSSFGYESEMIIQRGASYTITKVEKSGGTIYIDMEIHPEDGYDLFQQDPSEWTGSKKKGR